MHMWNDWMKCRGRARALAIQSNEMVTLSIKRQITQWHISMVNRGIGNSFYRWRRHQTHFMPFAAPIARESNKNKNTLQLNVDDNIKIPPDNVELQQLMSYPPLTTLDSFRQHNTIQYNASLCSMLKIACPLIARSESNTTTKRFNYGLWCDSYNCWLKQLELNMLTT